MINPILKLRKASRARNRSRVSDSLPRVSLGPTPPGQECLRRGAPPGGALRQAPAGAQAPRSLRPSSQPRGAERAAPLGAHSRSRQAPPQDVSALHLAGSDLGSGFRPLPGPQGPSPAAPGRWPPPLPGTTPSPPPPRALRTSETIPQRTQRLIKVPELPDRAASRTERSCVRGTLLHAVAA